MNNPNLTRREIQVLEMAIEPELTAKEIAEKLCMGVRTYNFHIRNIRTKFQIPADYGKPVRAELKKKALSLGMVSKEVREAFYAGVELGRQTELREWGSTQLFNKRFLTKEVK